MDISGGSKRLKYFVSAGYFTQDGMRLLGRGLQRPAKLLRVAVAVTGHNLRPSLIRVDLHDVGNGLGVARVVVRDNHGLGNIRRDGVAFLGNNVVSGTGNFAALIQFGT